MSTIYAINDIIVEDLNKFRIQKAADKERN